MFDKIFPKLHNEGYKFLVIFGLATLVLYLINGFLGLIGVVLTIWVYYFFRDPDRVSINNEDYLVSPADGVVLQVMETNGPKELNLENKKSFETIGIAFNEQEIESLPSMNFDKTLNKIITPKGIIQ